MYVMYRKKQREWVGDGRSVQGSEVEWRDVVRLWTADVLAVNRSWRLLG